MFDEHTVARFWSKVDQRDAHECWLWTACAKGRGGYGSFWFKPGYIPAHRFSLALSTGGFRPGLHALHSCDVPRCVNPNHLRWGTDAENMQDCLDRGRHEKAAKTHCPRGHPYSGDNLYHGPGKQGRVCKTCRMHNRQRTRAIAAAKGLRG